MSCKILIVDDDEATRTGIALLVTENGYVALTAGSVPEAMKILSDQHPDLLVTDIRLGQHNGLQLVAMSPVPIPAIVITGFADPLLEAEAQQLGADFLRKPVAPSALMRLVAKKLQRGGLRGRRWPRNASTPRTPVHVDYPSARLVDVSYGGVGIEIHIGDGEGVPTALRVTVPSRAVSLMAEVRWTMRTDATKWRCGAAIPDEALSEWAGFIEPFP